MSIWNSGLHSQTPNVSWVMQLYSSDGELNILHHEVDKQGNLYIIGHFTGTVNFNPNGTSHNVNSTYNSPFISKFTSCGNLIWIKKFSFNINSGLTADDIKFTSSNSKICLFLELDKGQYEVDPGPNDFVVGLEAHSLVIIQLDTHGNFDWAIPIKPYISGRTFVSNLSYDEKDNIIFTGQFFGQIDFDPGPGENIQTANAKFAEFICKINTNGSLNWVKIFDGEKLATLGNGNTSNTFRENFCIDQNNDIIYGTEFIGDSIDFDPGPGIIYPPNTDPLNLTTGYFILKLDSEGELLWVKHSEYSDYMIPNRMLIQNLKADTKGNIYCHGAFSGTIDFDPGQGEFNITSSVPFSPNQSFVTKLNPNGNFIWCKTLKGYSGSTRIRIDHNEEKLYVFGSFKDSIDLDPNNTYRLKNSGYHGFIAQWNEQGEFQWGGELRKSIVTSLEIGPFGNTFLSGLAIGDSVDVDPGQEELILQKSGGGHFVNFIVKLGSKVPILNLGNDTTLCFGESVFSESIFSQFPHIWSTGDTTTVLKPKNSGNYWLEVSTSCKTLRDSIHITIVKPTVYIGPDTAFCGLFEYQLNAQSPKQDSLISYTWNNGDTTPYTVVRKEGLYHVKVKDTFNCPAGDTMMLDKLFPPQINFTKVDCNQGSLNLQAAPSAQNQVTYRWNTGQNTPQITIYDTGWYGVEISRPFCVVSDSIYIDELCPINTHHLPSAFSPNGDALNEGFKPVGKQIEQFTLSIYNRWGECIFVSEPNQAWNGFYKNLPVSSGAYLYTVNIRFNDGKLKHHNGVVNVVR